MRVESRPFSKQLSKFVTLLLGEDLHLAEKGAQETSSVVVETVQKVSKNRAGQGVVLPLFKSDASKVTCKGMGLKKAYLQKQNMFTVSCADAGLSSHYLIPSKNLLDLSGLASGLIGHPEELSLAKFLSCPQVLPKPDYFSSVLLQVS